MMFVKVGTHYAVLLNRLLQYLLISGALPVIPTAIWPPTSSNAGEHGAPQHLSTGTLKWTDEHGREHMLLLHVPATRPTIPTSAATPVFQPAIPTFSHATSAFPHTATTYPPTTPGSPYPPTHLAYPTTHPPYPPTHPPYPPTHPPHPPTHPPYPPTHPPYPPTHPPHPPTHPPYLPTHPPYPPTHPPYPPTHPSYPPTYPSHLPSFQLQPPTLIPAYPPTTSTVPPSTSTVPPTTSPELSIQSLIFLQWTDDQGKNHEFSLQSQVSAQWKQFGHLLGITHNDLTCWDKQFRLDCKECWVQVMQHWLDGGSRSYPATWEGLYTLLENAGFGGVACKLKEIVGSFH